MFHVASCITQALTKGHVWRQAGSLRLPLLLSAALVSGEPMFPAHDLQQITPPIGNSSSQYISDPTLKVLMLCARSINSTAAPHPIHTLITHLCNRGENKPKPFRHGATHAVRLSDRSWILKCPPLTPQSHFSLHRLLNPCRHPRKQRLPRRLATFTPTQATHRPGSVLGVFVCVACKAHMRHRCQQWLQRLLRPVFAQLFIFGRQGHDICAAAS